MLNTGTFPLNDREDPDRSAAPGRRQRPDRGARAHGLAATIVEDGESCILDVTFADDEHERLVAGAVHAIEAYLSDRMLPLVVQRGDGGVIVRPPAD